MVYFDNVCRLMEGLPSMEQPVMVSGLYIKEVIVPALLHEPGMASHEHLVSSAVGGLDAQELYDLYGLVVHLFYNAVRALLSPWY